MATEITSHFPVADENTHPNQDVIISSLINNESVPEASTPQTSAARKWAGRLAMGALVAGGAYAVSSGALHEIKDDIAEDAPWEIGVALAGTEAMWVGGAAISLAAAGKRVKIRPGFKSTFREQLSEVTDDVLTSKAFKTGLYVNTAGAIGTAATIGVAAITRLPVETWPGALGVASIDIAGTLALRAPIYKGIHDRKDVIESKEALAPVKVREAKLEDIDRLADIDLLSFESSYGESLPAKDSVVDMLTTRFHNANGWMFVAEKDGQVEGFVTAFRTNKSAEEFVSWEDSTNNGTLEGVVGPEGKYAYVANLTVNREAEAKGAKDMLLANLFAKGIAEGGIEYGYFESRMPQFQEWLTIQGIEVSEQAELAKLAEQYTELRRDDGKRYDWQLRMYEGDGFKLGKPIAGAFDDEASMNFGVVCTAEVPGNNMIMRNFAPARKAFAAALRQVAKHPKLLSKVL